jgi:hypothetical protein
MPFGVGTPNSRSTALAWYSWMFIEKPPSFGLAGHGAFIADGRV